MYASLVPGQAESSLSRWDSQAQSCISHQSSSMHFYVQWLVFLTIFSFLLFFFLTQHLFLVFKTLAKFKNKKQHFCNSSILNLYIKLWEQFSFFPDRNRLRLTNPVLEKQITGITISCLASNPKTVVCNCTDKSKTMLLLTDETTHFSSYMN